MTHKIANLRMAMTAIAAVLAVTSPSFAQDSTPPDPGTDTAVETTPTVDPLAPDPSADTAVAPPAAPKPKVETVKTTSRPAKAAASTTRSTARKTSAAAVAAAPAAAPAPPVEAIPPASPAADIPPPAAAEPAPSTVAAPASASMSDQLDTFMTDDMALVGLGAGALGLIALGGAGIAMRRRKRRREEEEFEARQEFLDSAEDEGPGMEPAGVDQPAAGPAFARRAAPVHDPVPTGAAERSPVEPEAKIPERGNWESRQDAQFLFRRAAKEPVEQD